MKTHLFPALSILLVLFIILLPFVLLQLLFSLHLPFFALLYLDLLFRLPYLQRRNERPEQEGLTVPLVVLFATVAPALLLLPSLAIRKISTESCFSQRKNKNEEKKAILLLYNLSKPKANLAERERCNAPLPHINLNQKDCC